MCYRICSSNVGSTEVAGTIVKTGKSVTDYTIGDHVMFISSMHPKGGTWAGFAAVFGRKTDHSRTNHEPPGNSNGIVSIGIGSGVGQTTYNS